MVRSLIQRALVVLLFAALMAPVIEAFDQWDATPGLASDTEFHVAALAVAAGLIAAVALVAARISSTPAFSVQLQVGDAGEEKQPAPALLFFSGSSPPDLPLRI